MFRKREGALIVVLERRILGDMFRKITQFTYRDRSHLIF